jgi:hypothetical protein
VRAQGFTAWAGLAIPSRGIWVDLLLTVDDENASAWHHFILHQRPTTRTQTLRFVAEKHALLCDSLKTALAEDHCAAISPLASHCAYFERPGSILPVSVAVERLAFNLVDLSANFQLWIQPCPIQWKRSTQLNSGNIVAEIFPPAQVSNLAYLNQGMVLSDRYIEKIIELADTEFKDLKIAVFQPSPLAAWFDRFRHRSESGTGI